MTQTEIYDWLLERGIREPAVFVLGSRHVVGRWESMSSLLGNGYVCRAGRVAIVVLGWGEDWPDAFAQARACLDMTRAEA